ncbi:MAG: hypothetical protein M1821_007640 [Bathelium mastoideum]|nr:MAG: hypothetical protein M1821_007640 [Bathelium mastoideum]
MGTRGLQIVRFHKRYYIQYEQYDSDIELLGARIVASIPSDPGEYQEWLKSMRDRYLATEHAVEQHAAEIRDGSEPDYSQFPALTKLPSELPQLDGYDFAYAYIINLDCEIFTINYSIHWKLGNIPRRDNLWLRAITESIYPYEGTICPDICPEEHMASPALDLPQPVWEIGYDFREVSPKKKVEGAGKVLLTRIMAEVLVGYKDDIVGFGREWGPDSFPFRELAFSLISIASGHAELYSLSAQECLRTCHTWSCRKEHPPEKRGWLDEKWAGDKAPLLEFGSMAHRPGENPGVSPAETMYWLEDVLVSLSTVVDGKAITNAAFWGRQQGRTAFQMVVL